MYVSTIFNNHTLLLDIAFARILKYLPVKRSLFNLTKLTTLKLASLFVKNLLTDFITAI